MPLFLLLCLLGGVVLVVAVYLVLRKKHQPVSIPVQKYLAAPLPPIPTLPPSVLLFQVSAYANKEPDYVALTRARNEAYCRQWGYDYQTIHYPYGQMPVWWIRVHELVQHIDQYEYLVYMDLDAMVVDTSKALIDLFDFVNTTMATDFCVLVSADCSLTININSGVLLIRRTPMARQILRDWHEYCFCDAAATKLCNHCSSYTFDGQRWQCPECGPWAHYGYEQHALNHLYEKYSQHIGILPDAFLGRGGQVIRHLYGMDDAARMAHFQDLLKVD